MQYFFSASNVGFYTDEWHPNRPEDCVAITEERHKELLQLQFEGNQIVADEAGQPQAVERVHDAGAAIAHRARRELLATDHVPMKYFEAGTPVPSEWRDYREALRDVIRGNRTEFPVKPQ